MFHKSCRAEVKRLEDTIVIMRAGHQAESSALKAHIEFLGSQVKDLHKLVFVPEVSKTPSIEVLEADAVLGVSEKAPEMSETELNAILDGHRELDLLVSGNYDVDLLQ